MIQVTLVKLLSTLSSLVVVLVVVVIHLGVQVAVVLVDLELMSVGIH